MRITTDDGIGLAVEVAGDGPGLVLVHGHGGAKEDFADHVDTLSCTHTVVIFDHRGHGASDKPDDRSVYTLDRLATDTLQVADAVDLPSFRLLGHSMGGMAARKVVIREPSRVDALIMMDTCSGPVPGWDPELVQLGADVVYERGKPGLRDLIALVQPLETPSNQRVLRDRPGYQAFQDRKFDDMSSVMWATLALEIANQSDDLAALAAAVRGPRLVLVGEHDKAFFEASKVTAAGLDDAEFVVIEDAGHSPQFENPKAWIAAVELFLASVPTPTHS
jgi:pimeloyl-ACP methyl ester carboxylesterase